MNDIPSLHFIVNCVAGFSFLTSAALMACVRVPHAPMWKQLRRCKFYLSLVFLVVGLSCGKTVFFNLGPNRDIVVTSTLISAGIQSLLLACTGITFVNPRWVKSRWLWANLAVVATYAVMLVLGLQIWREWFWITGYLACLVYFALIISYQFVFYREYYRCVNNTDFLTDEDSEGRYAWIKHFFIAVTILGITAGVAPFMPTYIYDVWMLMAACFYAFVVGSFANYWGSTAQLVNAVYKAEQTVTEDSTPVEKKVSAPVQEEMNEREQKEFEALEKVLNAWVEERGFVKNDLVSEEFAQSLGVNITTLRAYFSYKYQTDFRQWRTKLRIDYACSILKENPDYSYDTIAEMVGIGDRSNFTRNFKKITGLTPREYAEQHKTEKD